MTILKADILNPANLHMDVYVVDIVDIFVEPDRFIDVGLLQTYRYVSVSVSILSNMCPYDNLSI